MGVLHPFPTEVCVPFKISLYTYTNFPFVLPTGKSPYPLPKFRHDEEGRPPPCQRCPPNPTSLPHFRYDKEGRPLLANVDTRFQHGKKGLPSCLVETRFRHDKEGHYPPCNVEPANRFVYPRATHGLLKNPYLYPSKTHIRVQVRVRVVAG